MGVFDGDDRDCDRDGHWNLRIDHAQHDHNADGECSGGSANDHDGAGESDGDGGTDGELRSGGGGDGTTELPVAEERREHRGGDFSKLYDGGNDDGR